MVPFLRSWWALVLPATSRVTLGSTWEEWAREKGTHPPLQGEENPAEHILSWEHANEAGEGARH